MLEAEIREMNCKDGGISTSLRIQWAGKEWVILSEPPEGTNPVDTLIFFK